MTECINCGNCCTPCLQITQYEIDIIKDYVKKNKIKELIYEKDGRLEYICPFRDQINQKCNIYEVRPSICRLYKCWEAGLGIEGHVTDLVNTSVYNGNGTLKKGTHEIFFNNAAFAERYKNENQ